MGLARFGDGEARDIEFALASPSRQSLDRGAIERAGGEIHFQKCAA
jgi:hypothetical protein